MRHLKHSQVAQIDRTLERRALDVRELREVAAARARLGAGAYGVCVDCGKGIIWERLEAYPTTTRCIPFAQWHEKTFAHEGMPTF